MWGALIWTLAACGPDACPEGTGRVASGECLDLVDGDEPIDRDTDTVPPPSEAPELSWEFAWWPDTDEGLCVLNYQVDDAQADVIQGRFVATVSNETRTIEIDAEVIWREDTCPAGDHTAFWCATINEYGHLNMYAPGVDRVSDYEIVATVSDKAGHVSNTEVSTTSWTKDQDN